MIFFDPSGKRWRRIKQMSYVSSALVSIPIMTIVSVGLAYEPSWEQLNIPSQQTLPTAVQLETDLPLTEPLPVLPLEDENQLTPKAITLSTFVLKPAKAADRSPEPGASTRSESPSAVPSDEPSAHDINPSPTPEPEIPAATPIPSPAPTPKIETPTPLQTPSPTITPTPVSTRRFIPTPGPTPSPRSNTPTRFSILPPLSASPTPVSTNNPVTLLPVIQATTFPFSSAPIEPIFVP